MGILTEEEVMKLPEKFDTVPYKAFFNLWYALQKSLPAEQKGEILTKIGRTIGKSFDPEGIETTSELLSRIRAFFEKDWPITDNAIVEAIKDADGEVTKLIVKQDSCKMCFANTYYRFKDSGSPSCMFPQVMMGLLSKVRRKFGFKNLRYEGVQKGGVGVCAMQWNVK